MALFVQDRSEAEIIRSALQIGRCESCSILRTTPFMLLYIFESLPNIIFLEVFWRVAVYWLFNNICD